MLRELQWFILVFLSFGRCNDFKQQRARIVYVNPEFSKEYSILTIREGRHAPYLTTLKFTALQGLGNNVTIRFEFSTDKQFTYPIKLEYKACDLIKTGWVQDWIKAYSNIPPNKCPLEPAAVEVVKFEIPPKNFPLTLSNVDYYGRTLVYATATKEKIAEVFIELKANDKKG